MKKNKAFTLVELLLVIVILGILAAVSIRYWRTAVATAQDAKKKNNSEDVRTALALYYKDHEDTFPIRSTDGGADVANLSTELNGTYLGNQSVLQPVSSKYTNKYITDSDGTNYAMAFGLEKNTYSVISSGSGYYQTNSSGIAGAVNIGNFISPALAFAAPTASTVVATDLDTGMTHNAPYNFSASFWIKPTDLSRQQYLVNQMTFNTAGSSVTDGLGWEISLIPGSDSSHANIKFTFCNDQTCTVKHQLVSTTSPVTLNSWSHVVFVGQIGNAYAYQQPATKSGHALAGEPSSSSVYFTILVNAVKVAYDSSPGCEAECSSWRTLSAPTIKFSYASTSAYAGYLDDLRLYGFYLDSSKVSSLYNSGRGSYGSCLPGVAGYCSGDDDLLAGWRLNEATGSPVSYFGIGSYTSTINPSRMSWQAAGVIPIGLSGIKTGNATTYSTTGRAYVLTNVQ